MAFGNTIRCTETGVHCQSICFTTESADVLMENKNFFTIQKKKLGTQKRIIAIGVGQCRTSKFLSSCFSTFHKFTQGSMQQE